MVWGSFQGGFKRRVQKEGSKGGLQKGSGGLLGKPPGLISFFRESSGCIRDIFRVDPPATSLFLAIVSDE